MNAFFASSIPSRAGKSTIIMDVYYGFLESVTYLSYGDISDNLCHHCFVDMVRCDEWTFCRTVRKRVACPCFPYTKSLDMAHL